LSANDIKNVIVEMRKSGYKLQEITDTLNIPRGTVSDVVVRFKRRGSVGNKPHTGATLTHFYDHIFDVI
jgi:Mn-dependent DtxR family transcriptional regulator